MNRDSVAGSGRLAGRLPPRRHVSGASQEPLRPLRPGEARLRSAAGRLRQPPSCGTMQDRRPPLEPKPSNPFEVAVSERLKAMQEDIEQIRSRLNWLLTIIVGAAATNVLLALFQ